MYCITPSRVLLGPAGPRSDPAVPAVRRRLCPARVLRPARRYGRAWRAGPECRRWRIAYTPLWTMRHSLHGKGSRPTPRFTTAAPPATSTSIGGGDAGRFGLMGAGLGAAQPAFGKQHRQAERGFCRELRQLRQHGAWPGRRREPRRRSAARLRKAPWAAVVRLCGGTGADPAGPRPEAAAAQSVSLPSHRSHRSLQPIGSLEVAVVTAGETPVTSGVRFTCN